MFEKCNLQVGEDIERSQLDHRFHLVLEQHRQYDDIARRCAEKRRADRYDLIRQAGDQQAALVERALPDQAAAHLDPRRIAVGVVVSVGREKRERTFLLVADAIDNAELRIDERGEFGKEQPAHSGEVALALKHIGELGEIALEPVLLGISVGGEPQVADHRVDVVFEFGHLAARIHLNRAGEVALGHCRRHFGDGTHLRRQVGCKQVDVAG